ncbi:MAG: hypothetical protein ABH883_01990 [Candidatus Omnitrophota bacterium]
MTVRKGLLLSLVFSIILPCAGVSASMTEIRMAENYDLNIPVKILKKMPLPKGYHEDLYYDGKNVWVSNGRGGKTWIIDAETGKSMGEITPPGTFTEAIAPFEGEEGVYWVTDWDEKRLYKTRLKNGKMIPLEMISLAPAFPTGVVSVDGNVYVIVWKRGMGTRYYLLCFDPKGNKISEARIENISEPCQMAWDGNNLWITSWYSRKIYKIDIKKNLILGEFKSPAKQTTGIAWDGEGFWITGTYDGLYKVKLQ